MAKNPQAQIDLVVNIVKGGTTAGLGAGVEASATRAAQQTQLVIESVEKLLALGKKAQSGVGQVLESALGPTIAQTPDQKRLQRQIEQRRRDVIRTFQEGQATFTLREQERLASGDASPEQVVYSLRQQLDLLRQRSSIDDAGIVALRERLRLSRLIAQVEAQSSREARREARANARLAREQQQAAISPSSIPSRRQAALDEGEMAGENRQRRAERIAAAQKRVAQHERAVESARNLEAQRIAAATAAAAAQDEAAQALAQARDARTQRDHLSGALPGGGLGRRDLVMAHLLNQREYEQGTQQMTPEEIYRDPKTRELQSRLRQSGEALAAADAAESAARDFEDAVKKAQALKTEAKQAEAAYAEVARRASEAAEAVNKGAGSYLRSQSLLRTAEQSQSGDTQRENLAATRVRLLDRRAAQAQAEEAARQQAGTADFGGQGELRDRLGSQIEQLREGTKTHKEVTAAIQEERDAVRALRDERIRLGDATTSYTRQEQRLLADLRKAQKDADRAEASRNPVDGRPVAPQNAAKGFVERASAARARGLEAVPDVEAVRAAYDEIRQINDDFWQHVRERREREGAGAVDFTPEESRAAVQLASIRNQSAKELVATTREQVVAAREELDAGLDAAKVLRDNKKTAGEALAIERQAIEAYEEKMRLMRASLESLEDQTDQARKMLGVVDETTESLQNRHKRFGSVQDSARVSGSGHRDTYTSFGINTSRLIQDASMFGMGGWQIGFMSIANNLPDIGRDWQTSMETARNALGEQASKAQMMKHVLGGMFAGGAGIMLGLSLATTLIQSWPVIAEAFKSETEKAAEAAREAATAARDEARARQSKTFVDGLATQLRYRREIEQVMARTLEYSKGEVKNADELKDRIEQMRDQSLRGGPSFYNPMAGIAQVIPVNINALKQGLGMRDSFGNAYNETWKGAEMDAVSQMTDQQKSALRSLILQYEEAEAAAKSYGGAAGGAFAEWSSAVMNQEAEIRGNLLAIQANTKGFFDEEAIKEAEHALEIARIRRDANKTSKEASEEFIRAEQNLLKLRREQSIAELTAYSEQVVRIATDLQQDVQPLFTNLFQIQLPSNLRPGAVRPDATGRDPVTGFGTPGTPTKIPGVSWTGVPLLDRSIRERERRYLEEEAEREAGEEERRVADAQAAQARREAAEQRRREAEERRRQRAADAAERLRIQGEQADARIREAEAEGQSLDIADVQGGSQAQQRIANIEAELKRKTGRTVSDATVVNRDRDGFGGDLSKRMADFRAAMRQLPDLEQRAARFAAALGTIQEGLVAKARRETAEVNRQIAEQTRARFMAALSVRQENEQMTLRGLQGAAAAERQMILSQSQETESLREQIATEEARTGDERNQDLINYLKARQDIIIAAQTRERTNAAEQRAWEQRQIAEQSRSMLSESGRALAVAREALAGAAGARERRRFGGLISTGGESDYDAMLRESEARRQNLLHERRQNRAEERLRLDELDRQERQEKAGVDPTNTEAIAAIEARFAEQRLAIQRSFLDRRSALVAEANAKDIQATEDYERNKAEITRSTIQEGFSASVSAYNAFYEITTANRREALIRSGMDEQRAAAQTEKNSRGIFLAGQALAGAEALVSAILGSQLTYEKTLKQTGSPGLAWAASGIAFAKGMANVAAIYAATIGSGRRTNAALRSVGSGGAGGGYGMSSSTGSARRSNEWSTSSAGSVAVTGVARNLSSKQPTAADIGREVGKQVVQAMVDVSYAPVLEARVSLEQQGGIYAAGQRETSRMTRSG